MNAREAVHTLLRAERDSFGGSGGAYTAKIKQGEALPENATYIIANRDSCTPLCVAMELTGLEKKAQEPTWERMKKVAEACISLQGTGAQIDAYVGGRKTAAWMVTEFNAQGVRMRMPAFEPANGHAFGRQLKQGGYYHEE